MLALSGSAGGVVGGGVVVEEDVVFGSALDVLEVVEVAEL